MTPPDPAARLAEIRRIVEAGGLLFNEEAVVLLAQLDKTLAPAAAPSGCGCREALRDLVSAHDGYRHGVGPCVCAAHEAARTALARCAGGGA